MLACAMRLRDNRPCGGRIVDIRHAREIQDDDDDLREPRSAPASTPSGVCVNVANANYLLKPLGPSRDGSVAGAAAAPGTAADSRSRCSASAA